MKQLIILRLFLLLMLALPASASARDFGRLESSPMERDNFSSGIERASNNERFADPFTDTGSNDNASGTLRGGSAESNNVVVGNGVPIGDGLWLLVLGGIVYCLIGVNEKRKREAHTMERG